MQCRSSVRYSPPALPTSAHRYSAGNFFGSKDSITQPSPVPVIPGSTPDPVQLDRVDPSASPAKAHLAWPLGIPVSLHFHLSTDPTGQVFTGHSKETGLPHFVWHDITFGNWSETRTVDYNLHLPEVRESCLWFNFMVLKSPVQVRSTQWIIMGAYLLNQGLRRPRPFQPKIQTRFRSPC